MSNLAITSFFMLPFAVYGDRIMPSYIGGDDCMRSLIVLSLLLFCLLAGCAKQESCAICGEESGILEPCQTCHATLCSDCIVHEDTDDLLQKLYESGDIIRYLEDMGYAVLDDPSSLYQYGLLSGYNQGTSGIIDREIAALLYLEYGEVDSDYYNTLDRMYRKYRMFPPEENESITFDELRKRIDEYTESDFYKAYKEGKDNGYIRGYDTGFEFGYETGYKEGEASGYESGLDDGYNKAINEK